MGASSSQLPYNLLGQKQLPNSAIWKLFDGTAKADGKEVSIFVFEKKEHGDVRLLAAQNFHQRLKTLHHPNVLKYVDGVEVPDTVYVVTERVEPAEFSVNMSEMGCSLALHQILSAVAFINAKCNLVHGNVSPGSLFVNKAGDWKLGGMELIYDHSSPIPQNTRANADILPSEYRSPELSSRSWNIIEKGPAWATDAWSLGCVIYQLFNRNLKRQQQLGSPGAVPQQLRKVYGGFLQTASQSRLSTEKALKSKFFQNELVQAVEFLSNLVIHTDKERFDFFSNFSAYLDKIPERVLKYKMLPLLISGLDYGTGQASFPYILECVVRIGEMLAEDEYEQSVVPCIIKLFTMNDRAIRINLLKHFEKLSKHIHSKVVNDNIWPHVVTGFTDVSTPLRELSLRCIPHFVPKLDKSVVETQVMRHLAKLQTDKEPAIRTNTTYCLAKIASMLTPDVQRKVLCSAFLRSLRDTFPPARMAGLACLKRCLPMFTFEETAKRIVPTIGPACMDPVFDVRTASLDLLAACQTRLVSFSQEMKKQADLAPAAGDSKQEESKSSLVGKMGSWAVSSLTKQIYGNSEKDNQKPASHVGDLDRSKFQPASSKPQPSAQIKSATAKPPSRSTSNTQSVSQSKSAKPAADDGWNDDFFGDLGGDEDEDDLVASLSLSSKPKKPSKAGQRRKASKSRGAIKPQLQPNAASDADPWDDFMADPVPAQPQPAANAFDDNPFEGILGAAPAKATPSKATSKSSSRLVKSSASNDGDDWGDLLSVGAQSKSVKPKPKPKPKPAVTRAAPKSKPAKQDSDDDWANFLNS